MVKLYPKYEPDAAFGVIVSVDANICYDASGKLLLAPALDQLGLWNLRQGVCSRSLITSPESPKPSLAITRVASFHSSVATGHADGTIRIWDCDKGACETTLNGHKGAVSALRHNSTGSLLASGSKDSRIIVWDLVGEAGLFSLCGHKDQVTDLIFLHADKKLVSCSKDKFVRVWDLETQHCVQIIGDHQTEVWSLDVDPGERYLVSGSADPELRFYQIRHDRLEDGMPRLDTDDKWEILKQFGEVRRQCTDRVASVRFNHRGNLLACQAAGKTVEIYQLLDDVDAKRKAKRRISRKKEKAALKGVAEVHVDGNLEASTTQDSRNPTVTVSDVFKLLHILRASKKICSVAFCPLTPSNNALATLALSLNNNTLEAYSVENSAVTRTHAIELQGHRSDIRSIALSSDSTILLSTSHNAVKIWNPSNGSCLRTIESEYGLCSALLPGNMHALVGTKSGTLEIIDIQSSCCVEVVEAHGGSIRSIALTPDGNGFVTCGADHDIKFWACQLTQKPGHGSRHLSVRNVRTLKMNDDVLVVSVSPDAKYIAASLIDCTVQVFFLDSLKFSFPLYGHKLPVLCMDISSDGGLIVTGSADKNLRIWGLDFGDLHKSIFAHADSVMAVQFVRDTHYMFSVGKDRLVKYWDADRFELISTLEGHHAEIWCLAISHRGDFVVTGSHDRSLRNWKRGDELCSAEEERENRLEEMLESDLGNINENIYGVQELPEDGSVRPTGIKTQERCNKADSIIEALDLAEAELKRMEQQKEELRNGKTSVLKPNPLFRQQSPYEYVLDKLSVVQPSDLEQILLSLTFSDVLTLMSFFKEWASIPHKECKDVLGFNLAAMDHLKEMLSIRSDAPFREAKAKLLEIRSQLSKRTEGRLEGRERKKRRKQKTSNEMTAGA
uniref:WD repeat-containing protein 3 n=1 Tax=Anthurium amnicola TaxID=1678845 RepID=A0A1D1Y8G0_9ARAE